MQINYVAPVIHSSMPESLSVADSPAAGVSGVSFSDWLNRALAPVAETEAEDKITGLGLMAGTENDLHNSVIAAQKAEIMLNLTVQMRNKIVESYQEVMRMQI